MSTKSDAEAKLERIADGIVDSIVEVPGDELLSDAYLEGRDPEASAERVRRVLLGAVNRWRKGRLAGARARLDATRERLRRADHDLPGTPGERMDLLVRAFDHQPWLRDQISVQHRDLRGLPDEDVIGFLVQLAELGALDEL